jgi:hypothetical protein
VSEVSSDHLNTSRYSSTRWPIDRRVVDSPEPTLCVRCQTIDFDTILDGDQQVDIHPQHVLDLGPVQDLASGCSLCQLFAAMAVTEEACTNCELQRTSTRTVLVNRGHFGCSISVVDNTGLNNTILLFVKPQPTSAPGRYQSPERWAHQRGYLSAMQPTRRSGNLGFRLISPANFDHQFVKDCISYCSSHHRQCKPGLDQIRSTFFRVIDCNTRQVVVAELGCQYLALSYVWGASNDDPASLDECPKLIKDSIDVTLTLEFQYLWVDRYCIDQLDAKDKHQQIQQMDLIYANAVATIIAAAGDDPGYGLSGVNGTLRMPQPQLRLRGHLLASTLPHPSVSVNRTKWVTRGWTYQESILSRRRILFTDEQVLFECNSMNCTESQSSILEELHAEYHGPEFTEDLTRSDRGEPRFIVSLERSALKCKTPSLNPTDIIHFLAQFSERELSYPADTIKAMQGILHMFSRAHRPVYHLEGVPLLSGLETGVFAEFSFLKGLSWFHTSPGERRLEFPSWSWAGWTGQLGDFFMFRETDPQTHAITTVCLETENGELGKFPKSTRQEDWHMFLSNLASKRFHTIRIQGYTIRSKAVYKIGRRSGFPEDFVTPLNELGPYRPKAGYLLQFEVEDDISVYLAPKWDLEGSQLEGKELTCICLSDHRSNSGIHVYLSMLVVQENPDGFAERVGCCDFFLQHAQEHGEWVSPTKTRWWSMLAKGMKLRRIRLR